VNPHFTKGRAGKNFLVSFRRQDKLPVAAFLIIPPLAEELNKSRRMLCRMANHLAELGFEVVMPDLFGTGDSEGDFADATWDLWREDLFDICTGLKANGYNINILAVRAGALLAYDLMSNKNLNCENLVFWQPVVSGDMWLTQFLRLKLAASIVNDTGSKETTKALKTRLSEGEAIEVAGYTVSPSLANGIKQLNLQNIAPSGCGKIFWLELIASDGKSVLPSSKKVLEKWNQSVEVHSETVIGQAFWSTTEITDADNLLLRTKTLLSVN